MKKRTKVLPLIWWERRRKLLGLKKRMKEMTLRLKKRTKVLGDPLIWWERRRKPYGVEEENEGDDAEVEEEKEGAGGPMDMVEEKKEAFWG
ncbi:hypothetical protein ACE6H2_010827 [Prunus campanulata]